ncbi:hypothetical protein D3C71_831030 [compost metagenome]
MSLLLLFLCPMLFVLGMFAGGMFQMMEARDELRPKLWNDNIYSRTMLKGHALLFGPDGEIVEAEWYSPRRSAREFGGKPSDYGFGWIDHEGDEVAFKPTGLLPVPTPDALKGDAKP